MRSEQTAPALVAKRSGLQIRFISLPRKCNANPRARRHSETRARASARSDDVYFVRCKPVAARLAVALYRAAVACAGNTQGHSNAGGAAASVAGAISCHPAAAALHLAIISTTLSDARKAVGSSCQRANFRALWHALKNSSHAAVSAACLSSPGRKRSTAVRKSRKWPSSFGAAMAVML